MTDFLTAVTPQALRVQTDALVRDRADVQTLAYMLGRSRILEWANTIGVAMDEELRTKVPPVPPYKLRGIVAASQESVFLWTGLKDAETLYSIFQKHAPRGAKGSVLDFGCGCGRMTRFLGNIADLHVHGSDVNPALTDWCAANLEKVSTVRNDFLPPLPYEANTFDFVYSLSIFTHLPRESARLWLDEIVRVTKPGGMVVLTTHGYAALKIIEASAVHQKMFSLSAEQTKDIRERFHEQRFVFFTAPEDLLKLANVGTTNYGKTFVHEDFIREHWPQSETEIVAFVPGAIRGWQDATVLRVTKPQ